MAADHCHDTLTFSFERRSVSKKCLTINKIGLIILQALSDARSRKGTVSIGQANTIIIESIIQLLLDKYRYPGQTFCHY